MSLTSTVITLPNNTPTLLAGEKTTVYVMSQTGAPYLGGSGVNGTNGIQLTPVGSVFRIELGRGDFLYGFAADSTFDVRVLTQG